MARIINKQDEAKHLPFEFNHNSKNFKKISQPLLDILKSQTTPKVTVFFVKDDPNIDIKVIFSILHDNEYIYLNADGVFFEWTGKDDELFPQYNLTNFTLKRHGVSSATARPVDALLTYLFVDNVLYTKYKLLFDQALKEVRDSNITELEYVLKQLLTNPNDYRF